MLRGKSMEQRRIAERDVFYDRVHRPFLWILTFTFLAWLAYSFYLFLITPPGQFFFDSMLASGSAVVLFAGFIAAGARGRMIATIDSLVANGVLMATAAERDDLIRRIDDLARRRRVRDAIIVTIAELMLLLGGFVVSPIAYQVMDGAPLQELLSEELGGRLVNGLPLMAAATLAGVLIGAGLGQLSAYGQIEAEAEKMGLGFEIHIADPDGAGGLRELRRFLISQASLALIPPTWFAVWFALTGLTMFQGYVFWRPYFVAIFFLSIFYLTLTLYTPARGVVRRIGRRIRQARLHKTGLKSDALGATVQRRWAILGPSVYFTIIAVYAALFAGGLVLSIESYHQGDYTVNTMVSCGLLGLCAPA